MADERYNKDTQRTVQGAFYMMGYDIGTALAIDAKSDIEPYSSK